MSLYFLCLLWFVIHGKKSSHNFGASVGFVVLVGRTSSWKTVAAFSFARTVARTPASRTTAPSPGNYCREPTVCFSIQPTTETSNILEDDDNESYAGRHVQRLLSSNDAVDQDEEILQHLPGTQDGFYVVEEFHVPNSIDLTRTSITDQTIQRLQLTPHNITLPVALMVLDPQRYPSLSKARKECRQGKIVLNDENKHKSSNTKDDIDLELGRDSNTQTDVVSSNIPIRRGVVGDRVLSGQWIGRQEAKATLLNTADDASPFWTLDKPTFHLPVVYEDDYFALVNKPAGKLVYKEGNKGRNNIRFALLHALHPPSRRVSQQQTVLNRPEPVHRLDFATSGLLVVGKTKQATVHLATQFADRQVHKTYTAIVQGIPHVPEASNTTNTALLTTKEAKKLGFHIHGMDATIDKIKGEKDKYEWTFVETEFDGKTTSTLWRILQKQDTGKTNDSICMVELKPKTGRYHQLRRLLAWTYQTPMVGDPVYGNYPSSGDTTDTGDSTPIAANSTSGTSLSRKFHRGLMLCSNRIILLHPYYNTRKGRAEWEKRIEKNGPSSSGVVRGGATDAEDEVLLYEGEDGKIYVSASIRRPPKFDKYMEIQRRIAMHSS